MRADYLAVQTDCDIGCCFYLADQVVRHTLGQCGAANKNCDFGCESSQVKGGLPGRVRPADYENLLTSHRRSLGRCGAIVDPAPDQSIDALDPDASIGDAHGQHDSAAAHLGLCWHPGQC